MAAYLRLFSFSVCFLLLTLSLPWAHGRRGDKGGRKGKLQSLSPAGEKWGYIDVRPGAHMFYWLYYTTHPDGFENRPWVIWLQGGPGYSSTGLGNFLMLGPLDHHGNSRNTTWIQEASVMFIDNPVGAGYSFVDDDSLYAKDLNDISRDLVAFIKVFLVENPTFQTLPVHIMGQSYGGRMAPAFSYELQKAVDAGEVQCHVAGTAIGNGWVSPADFIENFGPMLYQMSRIDDKSFQMAQQSADLFRATYESGNRDAKTLWDLYEEVLKYTFSGVGIYPYDVMDIRADVSRKRRSEPHEGLGGVKYPFSIYDKIGEMDVIMNGPVRRKLEVIPEEVEWGSKRDVIFEMMMDTDVLFNYVHIVDNLLNNTDVRVAVYSGQLDVICSTLGAMKWVQRLTWPGLAEYNKKDRTALYVPGTRLVETFVQAHENLKFYWNLNSGHAVPEDVPDATLRMLQRILEDADR